MILWKKKKIIKKKRKAPSVKITVLFSGLFLRGMPHIWLVFILSCYMNLIPFLSHLRGGGGWKQHQIAFDDLLHVHQTGKAVLL